MSQNIYMSAAYPTLLVNLAVDQFASRSTVYIIPEFVFYVNYVLFDNDINRGV